MAYQITGWRIKLQRLTCRSALYNWPAKIEHWPADSNGSNL